MKTTKNAFSPRPETDWMNNPSVTIQEHIDRVEGFDYVNIDPDLVSRYLAHEANIQQKEIRLNSIRNNRKVIMAHRAVTDTIKV
jgi:hypothetical protein